MKMLNRLCFVSVLSVFACFCGCSDDAGTADKGASAAQKGEVAKKSPDKKRPTPEAKDPKAVAFKSVVSPAIKPDAAIAIVNGVPITRAEYDRAMGLRSRIFCISKKLDPTKRNKDVDAYNNTTKEAALVELVIGEMIRQRCEKAGLSLPEKDLASAQKKFMSNIRRPNTPFEEYVGALPAEDGDEVRRHVAAFARSEFYLGQWATNDFRTVSDEEVSNRLEFVQSYQQSVSSRNEEAKRKAAAAKAEIMAGASFYSVTTNRAEIFKDDGKFWDVVELEDLEPDDELLKFLVAAKAGDISDPLDLDDGIGIVGVLLKEKGEAVDDKEPPDQYTLVRCMFNAYEEMDEPEDFEEMRKLLLDRKAESARAALVKDLFSDSKIEYPFGKKLFASAKKPRGKPNARRNKPRKAKAPKTGQAAARRAAPPKDVEGVQGSPENNAEPAKNE